jgi:hypothetical protein
MSEPNIVNDEVRRIRDGIEASVAGLTSQQLAWSPAGKWSTAQILEHLALAYGATAGAMTKFATTGDAKTGPPSARKQLLAFVVADLGYLPSGREAPEYTRPAGLAAEDSLRLIRQNLDAMEAALAAAEQRFGGQIRIGNHPVLGPLKMRQWRRFHWVHTRHHLRQITRLRQLQGLSAA